jgi:DNA-binding NtrC family response regulator
MSSGSLLLRFLETGEVQKVGSDRIDRNVNVRVIAATNRNLVEMIEQGQFREDLFYRLNVIPLHIPPLRERRDDIPILAEFFLNKYSKDMKRHGKKFAPEVKEAMMRHPWPGNIRELENAVQRSIALSDGDIITAKDLLETAAPTPDLRSIAAATAKGIGEEGLDLDATMTDIEMGYLKRALEMTGGNYTKAAQLLKMSLRSFRYKLQKYGIR